MSHRAEENASFYSKHEHFPWAPWTLFEKRCVRAIERIVQKFLRWWNERTYLHNVEYPNAACGFLGLCLGWFYGAIHPFWLSNFYLSRPFVCLSVHPSIMTLSSNKLTLTGEWLMEWVNQWVNEWVSQWMNELCMHFIRVKWSDVIFVSYDRCGQLAITSGHSGGKKLTHYYD